VVPVLVRHGQAIDLDRWVVDAALGLLLRSRQRTPGVVEVNLSSGAMAEPATFCAHLERAMTGADMAPAQLVLGMDLREVAEQPSGAAIVAQRAQALGCRVALDHAEATPRTLALLHRVPYDILRIDGALVHASGYDHGRLLLLRALLRAVERDGAEPVAEEVRDDLAVALLQRNGVTRGQGFFLDAPRDAAGVLGAA
jgi:EAL domain-containing protein (putative c-di-GMP-specific phosphodiesterase class I)